MTTLETKRIGQLNGPWSILLRVMLSTYPLVIAWAIWVTAETFAGIADRADGARYTLAEGRAIEAKIALLPPQDWRDRIIAIEKNQQVILSALARIEERLDIRRSNP